MHIYRVYIKNNWATQLYYAYCKAGDANTAQSTYANPYNTIVKVELVY